MIRHQCQVELDSYRLAQYVHGVPCYVCDEPNVFDAEMCRKCLAPMALAHQSKTQKYLPQMVAVLGASGAGKTVYLGMLMDLLSRPGSPLQVLARGAFSITLQQMTMAALARCEFPDKTSNEPDSWNWIHCLVTAGSRHTGTELILPDMAGEAIVEEVDHPGSFPVIRALLSKCAASLVLIDAIRLEESRHEQEHFAMKVLSFLDELPAQSRRGWRDQPIAVVLTKADQAESCFRDPAKFVREHAPGVWRQATERFKQVRFFASGVAGSCAFRLTMGGHRHRIPLRIEPRGIREPFEWTISNVKPLKRGKK